MGGESSGKSTLAAVLVDALPACLVPELLRAFVDQHGRPPLRDEQAGLLAAAIRLEEEAAATCTLPDLVADPAVLMTAVYSQLYFGDGSLIGPAVDHCRAYDLLVWCAPDFPWAPDGAQRDGPHERSAADAILAELVDTELRPRGIRVLRVTGDPAARVTSVLRAWQPGPLQGLT